MSMVYLLKKKCQSENFKVYAYDSNSLGIFSLIKNEFVCDLRDESMGENWIYDIGDEINSRQSQLIDAKRNDEDIEAIYDSWEQIIIVIDDLVEVADGDEFGIKNLVEEITKKAYGLKILLLAAADRDGIASNWDSTAKGIRESQVGILLGSIKNQEVYSLKVPYDMYEKELTIGEGYYVVKNKYVGLKVGTYTIIP